MTLRMLQTGQTMTIRRESSTGIRVCSCNQRRSNLQRRSKFHSQRSSLLSRWRWMILVCSRQSSQHLSAWLIGAVMAVVKVAKAGRDLSVRRRLQARVAVQANRASFTQLTIRGWGGQSHLLQRAGRHQISRRFPLVLLKRHQQVGMIAPILRASILTSTQTQKRSEPENSSNKNRFEKLKQLSLRHRVEVLQSTPNLMSRAS